MTTTMPAYCNDERVALDQMLDNRIPLQSQSERTLNMYEQCVQNMPEQSGPYQLESNQEINKNIAMREQNPTLYYHALNFAVEKKLTEVYREVGKGLGKDLEKYAQNKELLKELPVEEQKEIALALTNYIAQNANYDHSFLITKQTQNTTRAQGQENIESLYYCLCHNTGVCNDFAVTLNEMLNRLGFDSIAQKHLGGLAGDQQAMGHAAVQVKFEGEEPYILDPTHEISMNKKPQVTAETTLVSVVSDADRDIVDPDCPYTKEEIVQIKVSQKDEKLKSTGQLSPLASDEFEMSEMTKEAQRKAQETLTKNIKEQMNSSSSLVGEQFSERLAQQKDPNYDKSQMHSHSAYKEIQSSAPGLNPVDVFIDEKTSAQALANPNIQEAFYSDKDVMIEQRYACNNKSEEHLNAYRINLHLQFEPMNGEHILNHQLAQRKLTEYDTEFEKEFANAITREKSARVQNSPLKR